jgi:drug/metabolite transporter (DMT)-like permease
MLSAGRRTADLALLLALCLVWGYNWVLMKLALDYADPIDFAAWRTLPAALLLFAAMALLGRSLQPVAPGAVFFIGLLQTAGFTGFSNWALLTGAAGKTAVLAYTMPFWTLLLAWPILGERLAGLQWLAAGVALAGLALVVEPWRRQASVASELLAVTAGICWAGSAVLVKWLRQRRQMDLLSLTAWQLLFGAAALAVGALVLPSAPVRWTAEFTAILLYNIVLATAGAWLAWLYLLQRLSAAAAGLSVLLAPVIGVLASRLQLGERPDAFEASGMALIAAALLLLYWRRGPGR